MNKRDNLHHMIRMEYALNYMMKHMKDKLTLEEVAKAEHVNYNPLYFGNVFREYFDMSWKSYYIKLKMRDAARYIKYQRVYQNIAKIYGYTDAKSFSRAFVKEIGVTPAEFLNGNHPIPDMPDRKQICGTPIYMEYMNTKDISIKGVPLYCPAGKNQFQRLEDAAFALTCAGQWKPELQGSSYTGIWSYDENGTECYLIGLPKDQTPDNSSNLVSLDIDGGSYAVFSADRTEDDLKNAEISRMMARYAFKEWQYVNFKETNRMGFTYESFEAQKLYLYVPLLGEHGDNDYWRENMQASILREYIDSHITHEIRLEDYAENAYYTERWLRDSFKNLYGITPQKYIEQKRMKLAAGEIMEKNEEKALILKKYHFASSSSFAKKFINHFGISYENYQEREIDLPETISVDPDSSERIHLTVVNLPKFRVALHPLSTMPEYMDIADYPGLVTYWFTHEYRHNAIGYDPKSTGNIDKIFIYDINLFQKNRTTEYEYSIGPVLETGTDLKTGTSTVKEIIPEGYQERILPGGKYVRFEMEQSAASHNLLMLYQKMESNVFLKWYYENQLLVSTTKKKLIRYVNGKMYFYIPLDV